MADAVDVNVFFYEDHPKRAAVQLLAVIIFTFSAWGCCCCAVGASCIALCQRRDRAQPPHVLELPSGARVSVWSPPTRKQQRSRT